MDILVTLFIIGAMILLVKGICFAIKASLYLLLIPLLVIFIPAFIFGFIFPISIMAGVVGMMAGLFGALFPLVPVLLVVYGIFLLVK